MIIAVTIFSFVYWGSSRYDSSRAGGDNFGTMDGERITREEVADTRGEVYLQYFLRYGAWPDRNSQQTGFDEQKQISQWLFLVRKQKEYNINVDEETVAFAAKNVLRDFENRSHTPADAFAQQHADDLERYIRHELGREQLFAIVGLSGELVTMKEARSLYERENQEIATEAVFFSGSNYLAAVPVPPVGALAEFYTNEMSTYRVPERAQVSYVAFSVTNLLARAERGYTNLTADIEATLNRFGTNISRFGKTPEEAKAKIRTELIHEKALYEARSQADAFAGELFDMNPVQAGNLTALAKKKGLSAQVTRPFDEENGPSEFDGGPNFAKAAFSLTAEEPFAGQPIISESTVFVIALENRLPSEIPSFNQIRDRVTADYKFQQALLLSHQAGESFAQTATAGLAQKKSFATLCTESRVKPVTLSPFSLSTEELPAVEDLVSFSEFKRTAFSTAPGTVSNFHPTRDGGVVVYVARLLPIDQSKMEARWPVFLNNLRRSRQMEAVNAWAMVEEPKSLRNSVWGQQRQAAGSGSGAEP